MLNSDKIGNMYLAELYMYLKERVGMTPKVNQRQRI